MSDYQFTVACITLVLCVHCVASAWKARAPKVHNIKTANIYTESQRNQEPDDE